MAKLAEQIVLTSFGESELLPDFTQVNVAVPARPNGAVLNGARLTETSSPSSWAAH
jgi:hypothetical protein